MRSPSAGNVGARAARTTAGPRQASRRGADGGAFPLVARHAAILCARARCGQRLIVRFRWCWLRKLCKLGRRALSRRHGVADRNVRRWVDEACALEALRHAM